MVIGVGGMVDSIPVFAALGWVTAQGHRVALVKCDRQRPGNGSGLVKRTVRIDGKLWLCTSVDRDKATGPMLPGERIYLWVGAPSSA